MSCQSESVEDRRARARLYYHTHPEQQQKAKDRSKLRRQNPLHTQSILESKYRWRDANKEKLLLDKRRRHRALKIEVLTHYGGSILSCNHCGFTDIRALTIDHINNNGAEEKRKHPEFTPYARLKRLGYPEGYQTLCMNCQFIKREEIYEIPSK